MLDLSRYLLGVADLALLVGFAWLGASALRSRLLPAFFGTPAHLATAVLALAILIWIAEALGTFGFFEPVPYLLAVALAGLGAWALGRRTSAPPAGGAVAGDPRGAEARSAPSTVGVAAATGPAGQGARSSVTTLIALAIAAAAVIKFGAEVRLKLGTGMTGFDSTWYHGPFAAGFFQSGDTWDLHYIAPQFLAWFYPANSELFHAIGMLAFDRDLLSPLLNLGWLLGCLVACWCIGRPYGVAPWSLAMGAVALSVPALSDQAGEARNDVVGIFFLLAAVAVAVNAWTTRPAADDRDDDEELGRCGLPAGALVVPSLAAGLAAGTKLTFLLPAAVLVAGLPLISLKGERGRAFVVAGLAALAGGGYWYLRNLLHTGNPLPWIDQIGPLALPAPDQPLGGREGHSVLDYLFEGAVWSDWFLPGFHDGLWLVWPLLLVAAAAGLLLCLGRGVSPVLRVAGAAGLAAAFAWLIAPTSASGPEEMPRGFESGLRYLVPALVLGLAILPVALLPRVARFRRLRGVGVGHPPNGRILKVPPSLGRHLSGRGMPHPHLGVVGLAILAIALGYPVQRHYLEHRYADPSFSAPGLNAAFAWARDVSGARIATTSTRQYPLFGADLSNQVEFVGIERPHGSFVAPSTCRAWRQVLAAGDYEYVIASRDRLEPGKPPYPPTARWTEGPAARVVLRQPPTIVLRLSGRLPPSACQDEPLVEADPGPTMIGEQPGGP